MTDAEYIERLEAAVIVAASLPAATVALREVAEEVRRERILRAASPLDAGEAQQVLR